MPSSSVPGRMPEKIRTGKDIAEQLAILNRGRLMALDAGPINPPLPVATAHHFNRCRGCPLLQLRSDYGNFFLSEHAAPPRLDLGRFDVRRGPVGRDLRIDGQLEKLPQNRILFLFARRNHGLPFCSARHARHSMTVVASISLTSTLRCSKKRQGSRDAPCRDSPPPISSGRRSAFGLW
jgi:hypothetical protein